MCSCGRGFVLSSIGFVRVGGCEDWGSKKKTHTFDTCKEIAVVVVGALERVANHDSVLALPADFDGLSCSWCARRHGGLFVRFAFPRPVQVKPQQLCMYMCVRTSERARRFIFLLVSDGCVGK